MLLFVVKYFTLLLFFITIISFASAQILLYYNQSLFFLENWVEFNVYLLFLWILMLQCAAVFLIVVKCIDMIYSLINRDEDDE
jgi:hypothetical protein